MAAEEVPPLQGQGAFGHDNPPDYICQDTDTVGKNQQNGDYSDYGRIDIEIFTKSAANTGDFAVGN